MKRLSKRKRPVPYCRRTWSPAERLAYYSTPDPLSGCHIWHGPSVNGGYGMIRYHGQKWLAHRLAWTLKNGPIPKGMILCHRTRRGPDSGQIYILYRGLEMKGKVNVRLLLDAIKPPTADEDHKP